MDKEVNENIQGPSNFDASFFKRDEHPVCIREHSMIPILKLQA